jgi:hypothetical protein
LSLRGKVRVANQFVAPKLWHLLHHFQPRSACVRSIQSALVNFVWGTGKHWVEASTVCAPVREGGLGLVDVADKIQAFRFLFIQRYLEAPSSTPWKAIASTFLSGSLRRNDFYASVKRSWEAMSVQVTGAEGSRATAEWPPSDSSGPHVFVSRARRKLRTIPVPKREVYGEMIYMGKGNSWPMIGYQVDEAIRWHAVWSNPAFGRDCDAAWRLAHGRWADAPFLRRAGLREHDVCRWCPAEPASSWHIAHECREAKLLWQKIKAPLSKLTGSNRITLRDIHVGYYLGKSKTKEALLANFLTCVAKAGIYKCFTACERGKRGAADYWNFCRKEIARRLNMEYVHDMAENNIAHFKSLWCHGQVLCKIDDEGALKLAPFLEETRPLPDETPDEDREATINDDGEM